MTTFLAVLTLLTLTSLGLYATFWPVVRASTLRYAWFWTGIALSGVLGTEWLVVGAQAAPEADWLNPTRYMAAVLLFCPMMSVLGSKRPHDQAWQWIVLSLWGILVLPALEWFAVQRGAVMEIHGVRAWFLLLLILMNCIHGIGGRGAWIGACVAIAQYLMLQEHLPNLVPRVMSASYNMGRDQPSVLSLAAIGAIDMALLVAFWIAKSAPMAPGLDRAWRDFRDQFGTLWALRVMERVNAAAAAGGWRTRLEWRGFTTTNAEDSLGHSAAQGPLPRDAEIAATNGTGAESLACQQTLWNLLRRFVSVEWSEARGWTPPASKVD